MDRTIEITASDALRFSPSSVRVAPGETVTFQVHNDGALVHEFVLGTEGDQVQHEVEMRRMPPGTTDEHVREEPNGIRIAPGQTGELTWTFPEKAGAPILFGCHEAGHYAAGMNGTIRLAPPPSPQHR